MPFSLLIMAGPSTIFTSATMASGICSGARGSRRAPGYCHAAAIHRRARSHRRRGRIDQQVLHVLFVLAEGAGVADAHGKSLASFHRHGDGLAAQGGFDHVLNVADVDAVAGRPVAVDLDFQVALAARFGREPRRPRRGPCRSTLGHLFGDLLDLVQVAAEDLHADHRSARPWPACRCG